MEDSSNEARVDFMRNIHCRKLVFASACSIAALVTATPALAQSAGQAEAPLATLAQADAPVGGNAQSDGAAADDTTIVVSGIRGSLQRNLDEKRAASGVIEVISAEDIGKFPDSNVASALQRLPGVSIQRSGQRGDATGVTIRGFGGDFVDTLFDGRHISTATGTRAVDFTTVGSDFVGQLAVLKTPDVALSTSAIGGTINISQPKPFDKDGLQLVGSVSGSLQSRDKNVRPTAGVLFSDTFADNTIGILADVTYSRRDTVSNLAHIQGWVGINLYPCQRTAACTVPDFTPANAETAPAWFPQQIAAEQDFNQDKRIGGRVALQWRPSDNILLTIDDNYSRQTVDGGASSYAGWFNGTDLRNVKTDSNGTIVDFNQFGTPNDFIGTRTHNINETNQVGGNVKWTIIDGLSFDADASYSRSTLNPNHKGRQDTQFLGYGGTNPGGPFVSLPCTFPAGATRTTPPDSCATYNTVLGANTGVAILGPSTKYLPQIHDFGPLGNAANFGNPAYIGSHVIVRTPAYNTDAIKQARAALAWDGDKLHVALGGQYQEDKLHQEQANTFNNGVFASRSGYGPLSGRPGGSTGGLTTLPADVYLGNISTAGFIPGYTGTTPPFVINFDPYKVFSLLEASGGSVAPRLDPGSILDVTERTYAIFFKASFDDEIAGMPFHVSAGIRDEGTNVTTQAIGRQLLGLYRPLGDPTLITADPNLGPNHDGYSASTTITAKSNYNYLLPSIDAKLEVTDKLIFRMDASRTLTRPLLADLRPTVNVGTLRVGNLTGSGGNPYLKPYLSDNFDAAVEWYYGRNSYFALNGYLKHITDFVVGGVTSQTINDVIDPSTGQIAKFNVNAKINGPDATVKGLEIAWQQVFGQSGFGFTANATLPVTNRKFDSSDISGAGFSITGLAKSANFVGFYDKNGFQARVAVNWRDSYLLQLGQGSTGAFGAEPVYVNRQLQIDLSSSWDVTRQITVFGEATNLNNSTYSTRGRFSNQALDIYSYGRRFTLGVRFHY